MSKTNEQIIIDAYNNVLNRQPDPEGSRSYLKLLNNPDNFFNTQEELENDLRKSNEAAIPKVNYCASLSIIQKEKDNKLNKLN